MRTLFSGLHRPRLWQFLTVLLGLCLCGCDSKSLPKTHSVTVQLILKKTRQPFSQCLVELESVADPSIKAYGDPGEDGLFRFISFREKEDPSVRRETPGVTLGEHRVRIEVGRIGDRAEGTRVASPIHARYESYETSDLKITIPAQSDPITIELDPP